MENHLQKIRAEQPGLNPTEIYGLLSKAMLPEVLEAEIDFDSFLESLEQYTDRLDDLHATLRDGEKPQSADEPPEQTVEEWLEALRSGHRGLDSLYEELEDIACNLPDKEHIEEMVDEKIRSEYPQFHQEYLEHRQWLAANEERLARQEQRQFSDEPGQTLNQDGHTR
jgi:hypothetical protein